MTKYATMEQHKEVLRKQLDYIASLAPNEEELERVLELMYMISGMPGQEVIDEYRRDHAE